MAILGKPNHLQEMALDANSHRRLWWRALPQFSEYRVPRSGSGHLHRR